MNGPTGIQLAGEALLDGAGRADAASLARRAANPGDKATAERTAKAFEAVLTEMAFAEMRKSVQRSGLFDDPTSEQMDDLVWSLLGRQTGEQGGLGLWKDVYRQIAGPEAAGTVDQEA